MNLLKDILLQLFFLFLPLFLYYQLKNKYKSKITEFKRQWIFFLYCAVSVSTCMLFPIEFQDGYIFNLAFIPVILSILYGGYLSGILTILILFIYPLFTTGTTSFLPIFLTVPFIVLIPAIIQPIWNNYPKYKKYLLSLAIITVKLPIYFLFIVFHEVTGDFPAPASFLSALMCWLILSFSMVLLICFNEYFLDLGNLRKQLKKMRWLHHVSTKAKDISEEIHNPLTIVRGFTQLLGEEQNKTNKEYVPIILAELEKAESIIHSYINLAEADTLPAKSVSSKELVEGVLDLLQTYAANNRIQLLGGPFHNVRLRGNKERLTESFISILKICIDAMPPSGGKITVKSFRKGNEVIFEIADVEGKMKGATLQQLESYQYPSENRHNDQVNTAFTVLFAHHGDIEVKRGFFRSNVILLTLPAAIKKKKRINHKVVSP